MDNPSDELKRTNGDPYLSPSKRGGYLFSGPGACRPHFRRLADANGLRATNLRAERHPYQAPEGTEHRQQEYDNHDQLKLLGAVFGSGKLL